VPLTKEALTDYYFALAFGSGGYYQIGFDRSAFVGEPHLWWAQLVH
jgi:hypothetical protein